MAKCTNDLKKVFDHISWSHLGLQLRNHMIFFLVFLALWFVAMENMSNIYSCGTVSPLGHFLLTVLKLSLAMIHRQCETWYLWGWSCSLFAMSRRNGNLAGRMGKCYCPSDVMLWGEKLIDFDHILSLAFLREECGILIHQRFPGYLKSKSPDPVAVICATFCLFYDYTSLLIKELQYSSISLYPTAEKQLY